MEGAAELQARGCRSPARAGRPAERTLAVMGAAATLVGSARAFTAAPWQSSTHRPLTSTQRNASVAAPPIAVQSTRPRPVVTNSGTHATQAAGRLPCAVGTAGLVGAAALTLGHSARGGGRGAASCIARRAQDFYEVLGVGKYANDADIKSAFRRLAKKYHPDVNRKPGAGKKFQSIARSYEVLSDPVKRQRYDQFGEAGLEGMGAGPDMSAWNIDDIFSDLFGGVGGKGGSRRKASPQDPHRGSDLQCEVQIPFNEACFGGERQVQIRREETCTTCSGRGLKESRGKSMCPHCRGSGVVVQMNHTVLGVMQTQQLCRYCGGKGIDPSALCGNCRGKGTRPEVKEVTVKVPVGCDNGNRLRVRGAGDKGIRGGPPGDLYIAMKVTPSNEFLREGFDIYTDTPLSVYGALLGTTLMVKTIDGQAKITVPAGTQPETRLRIRGQGVPKLGRAGQRGDHYITMKVAIPCGLSGKEKELVEELRDSTP